jgi:uncharacterized protein YbjT (DUF2867 family)
MKILITSPLSSIGRRVLPELLAPEFSVRALVPNPNWLPDEIRDRVQIVPGSADNAATLRRALAGVEALLWSVPRDLFHAPRTPEQIERSAHVVSKAIKEAGTSRIVAVWADGLGLDDSFGSWSNSQAVEQILNESGASICHLSAAWSMENLLEQAGSILQAGLFTYPLARDLRLPMTALADVAEVALSKLVRRDWTGIERLAVKGPQELSFPQAAEVMERILERPVRYEEISQAATAGVAETPLEVTRRYTGLEPDTIAVTTPTTLASWVRNEWVPFLGSTDRNAEGLEIPLRRSAPGVLCGAV